MPSTISQHPPRLMTRERSRPLATPAPLVTGAATMDNISNITFTKNGIPLFQHMVVQGCMYTYQPYILRRTSFWGTGFFRCATCYIEGVQTVLSAATVSLHNGLRTKSRIIKGKRTLSKGALGQKSKVKSPKSRRVKGRNGKKSTVKKSKEIKVKRLKVETAISQQLKSKDGKKSMVKKSNRIKSQKTKSRNGKKSTVKKY